MNKLVKFKDGKIRIFEGPLMTDYRYEFTVTEAKELVKQLNESIVEAYNYELSANKIPQSIKNIVDEFVSDCLWEYDEHGADYDHGINFGEIAEETAPKLAGLNKEEITAIFIYIIGKNSNMDHGLSLLLAEMYNQKIYDQEMILDIIKQNEELKFCEF